MSEQRVSPPLWAPSYDAGFGEAVRRFWRGYVDFSGRASRNEYWWTFLMIGLGYVVALVAVYLPLIVLAFSRSEQSLIWSFVGPFLLVGWFFATILPWLALEARRLHDGDFPATFLFLHLATGFGALAVFVMCQLPPNPRGRRFDAVPGEAPRGGQPGPWPPAPGEPDGPYPPASGGMPAFPGAPWQRAPWQQAVGQQPAQPDGHPAQPAPPPAQDDDRSDR